MDVLDKLNVDALVAFASTTGLQFLINLVAAAAIFIIGRWVAKAVHRVVIKGMERANVEPLLIKFLGNILYALLLIFVVLAAISRIGIQTASLIAVIGAAGLAVGLAERRRPAGIDPAAAQGIHEVPHAQALTDIVLGIQVPSRVECQAAPGDHLGSERNVRGHHQVTGLRLLHDVIVGHVEAGGDLNRADVP